MLILAVLGAALSGCVGYYGGGGGDWGGGYYDAGALGYGDWGGGYRVGPFRDGGHFRRGGGGRMIPGIPMGRGGGFHGGRH